MINHTANVLALRTRALTLVVCTTGSTSLSSTATGYARAAGSFITDGFAIGMEVTPAGFPQTATGVVIGVTASDLTIDGGRTIAVADVGRTLSVGLPTLMAWENTKITPVAGVPWALEQYLPGPMLQRTFGTYGALEATPQYGITFYGPPETDILALYAYADAWLALFPPRQAIALGNGDLMRVRTDVSPFRSQLRLDPDGWSYLSVTVPLWLHTANSI